MITIDPETERQLERMTLLQGIINREGDYTEEAAFDEYRELLHSVTPKLLPTIQKLVRAGLFSMHIEEHALKEAEGFSDVTYDVAAAFDNGAIWLVAGQWGSGTPHKHIPDGIHRNN